MKQKYSLWYIKILRFGIGAIMVVAPFYATLSVWAASRLRHFDFFKIWKEFALTALGLVLAGFLITHHKFVRRVMRSRLAIIVAAYILLILTIGIYDLASHRVSNEAIIYGLLVDLRPVVFFSLVFLTFVIGFRKQVGGFAWRRITLLPALLVVLFGLMQMAILPNDILTHAGYGPDTIKPFQTIDNQSELVRIQSTLRGANPLGAYLVIVITMVAAVFIANKRRRVWWGIFGISALIVLIGTYSRSAEIGLLLSLLTLLIIYRGKFIHRHLYIACVCTILLAGTGVFLVARNNYFAENIVFHSSDNSPSSSSSNSERLAAISRAASEVVNNPLGTGVGSAGPASARNELGEIRIAENYFLQIGQEVGVIGMALFIAINLLIAKQLWRRRSEQLAKILLASLIGLTFVNLVSHAWTDDTLAYLWWGLAGIALAPAILGAKRKQNETSN